MAGYALAITIISIHNITFSRSAPSVFNQVVTAWLTGRMILWQKISGFAFLTNKKRSRRTVPQLAFICTGFLEGYSPQMLLGQLQVAGLSTSTPISA
jgi:hypothetical protein